MDADELLRVGIHLYHAGDLRESARRLVASLAEAQREGDLETEMMVRANLAEAYTVAGKLEEAERTAMALLKRARKAGRRDDEVRAIGRLAIAVLQRDARGQWKQLHPELDDSVRMARRIQLDYWVVQNLETLGHCALRTGQAHLALTSYQDALTSIPGDLHESDFFRARIYAGLSELYAAKEPIERSNEYLNLAHEFCAEAGSPHLRAQVKLAEGRCALRRHDLDQALASADDAYSAARLQGWRVEEQSAAFLLAHVYVDHDDGDLAATAAETGLELACEMSMAEAEVEGLALLARARCQQRDVAEARTLFQEALDKARQRGYDDHAAAIVLELAAAR